MKQLFLTIFTFLFMIFGGGNDGDITAGEVTVTEETVTTYEETAATSQSQPIEVPAPVKPQKIALPILMYHHFDDNVTSDMIVTAETFESHIKALADAGYTAVTFDEVTDYVENGAPLPQKPICITIDDGYESTYDIAFPILKKYNMKATSFVIGVAMGWQTYKDTEHPDIPRFSWEQAKEMQDSGVIDIQCHTYDMHQWPPFEPEGAIVRPNVLKLDGESEEEYMQALEADFNAFIQIYEKELGKKPTVIAYPNGQYSKLAEKIAQANGFKVTLSTRHGSNKLTKGSGQNLYLLRRYTITNDFTEKGLLKLLGN